MSTFLTSFTSDGMILLSISLLIAEIFFGLLLFLREGRLSRREGRFVKHSAHLIEEAAKKSQGIIETASDKSTEIIAKTNVVTDAVREEMDRSFSRAIRKNEEHIGTMMQRLSEENEAFADNLRQQFTDESARLMKALSWQNEQEVKSFVEDLKGRTVQTHSDMEKTLQESFNKALLEVESYKKKRLDEVEQSLPTLLLNISKEFLGRVITVPEHEKLVFESLEQAKKEGVFSSSVDSKTVRQ